ncbi:MAG TPA: hypothetical protein VFQ53_04340 [Kofleriaceae bacterium]|nr:hypothetical protein [Kofleriaceae bacterium]
MQRRRRLGWLGPAIVGLGVVVSIVGLWVMLASRPKAGAVIDTIQADPDTQFVVRAEDGGDRNFVELVHKGEVMWQALVPPYAGRPGAPGIAWGQTAVTVRVIRDGRAEIFALARTDASKLGGFKLAPGQGKVVKQTTGPVTLTDHVRSYEFVAGPGWNHVVAIDLMTGEPVWKQELGATPIRDASLANDVLWIDQGGSRRGLRALDGSAVSTSSIAPKS